MISGWRYKRLTPAFFRLCYLLLHFPLPDFQSLFVGLVVYKCNLRSGDIKHPVSTAKNNAIVRLLFYERDQLCQQLKMLELRTLENACVQHRPSNRQAFIRNYIAKHQAWQHAFITLASK